MINDNFWPSNSFTTCNCACGTCMGGGCCLTKPSYPYWSWTTTSAPTLWHTHKWEAQGIRGRGRKARVIQSCTCGEVRAVEVPA